MPGVITEFKFLFKFLNLSGVLYFVVMRVDSRWLLKSYGKLEMSWNLSSLSIEYRGEMSWNSYWLIFMIKNC